jgi:NADH-quinone oxidoreductase subunit M
MGIPLFSGFIAEFPIFMGLWTDPRYAWIAIVAALSIVITAAYIIRIIGKVFFSPLPAELEGHIHDVSVLDKVAVVFLAAIMIAMGVFPSLIVPLVQSGVDNVMRLLGGA